MSKLPYLPLTLRFRLQELIFKENFIRSDNVIPVRYVNFIPGTDLLEATHHGTLIGFESQPEFDGWVTLLYVDNKLVGSMKLIGGPTIIGLRNVQDSSGRFPLLSGGVYATTLEITAQAEQAFRQQGKRAVLYLDQLPLYPLRFAWADSGFRMVSEYARELEKVRKRL